jgi:hypothetical protein
MCFGVQIIRNPVFPQRDARKLNASTPTLQEQTNGAGEGNRTLVFSLEGYCSTIELHPLCAVMLHNQIRFGQIMLAHLASSWLVEGVGFEPT